MDPEPQQIPAQAPVPPPVKATPKRILIVEDDDDTRTALSWKLKKEGVLSDEALTGEEALQKVRLSEYALVLLDVHIPGKDGFSVLQEIKNDEHMQHIKVVVFTNFTSIGAESIYDKALSLGADKVILKANTSIEEIMVCIKEFLV